MATLIPITVDGIPTQAQVEYSSSQVSQSYLQSLQAFIEILNIVDQKDSKGNTIKTAASSLSAGNVAAIIQSIQHLLSLAKSGVTTLDPVTLYQLNQKYPNGIPP